MTPEKTLDWLAQQHFDQCREERPIQDWIRKMKSQLPAQPEQEPVAWMCHPFGDDEVEYGPHKECENCIPLYTTPPQRTWVGLTDEQKHQLNQSLNLQGRFPIIDAIEAICKGNNT